MDDKVKQLAAEKADQYGRSALEDRVRISEWLWAEGLPDEDEDLDNFEDALREALGSGR